MMTKRLLLVISILNLLSLSGCGDSSQNTNLIKTEEATILGKEHQQDLINLSDLDLPQPVDRLIDIPDDVGSLTGSQKEDKINFPVNPPVRSNPRLEEGTKKEEVKQKPPEPEADIRLAREGRGSVYYIPVIGTERKCEINNQVHMRDLSGRVLALMCKSEIADCAMQGSCYYSDVKGVQLFSYRKLVEIKDPKSGKTYNEPRFVINSEHTRCPHGMGFRRICLDPYRSVAADMKFHKAGEVFFIPILRGQILPNGEKHDGYVVVRDIGGAILGEGRFDFYIGFDSYVGHIFSKLNLSNPKRSTFTYYKVPDERAEQVRQGRAYPLVPTKVSERAKLALSRSIGETEVRAVVSQIDISTEYFLEKFKF